MKIILFQSQISIGGLSRYARSPAKGDGARQGQGGEVLRLESGWEFYVQGGSGSKIVDARETFGTLLEISK